MSSRPYVVQKSSGHTPQNLVALDHEKVFINIFYLNFKFASINLIHLSHKQPDPTDEKIFKLLLFSNFIFILYRNNGIWSNCKISL